MIVPKAVLPEAERRAADLAVARYGADRAHVEAAYRSVVGAQSRGQRADLIDTLVGLGLLTDAQGRGLRGDLNGTEAEPAAPADKPSGAYLRTLGSYRLLRKLGRGGMGSVYLGYAERDGRQVAIKVLSEQLAGNQDYVERFHREAHSGALLNHPNMVRCIAVGQDGPTGRHYLVLEYVDGPSARTLLDRSGHLSVGDAVHIVLDVARALEHAHGRNVVHRDIKPDNILLTASGVAKLADLGLAKRTDESSSLTALRQGFGTLDYIPCEQAFNAKHADARSDIYALGATLYHLLTGEVPFPGKTPVEIAERKMNGAFRPASELNREVPPALDAILSRMMAAIPGERYQMVSEAIVDLERSGLAARVPSFADPVLARRDPQARGNRPGQVTQLDVDSKLSGAPEAGGAWYIRFRNREGRWCKTRMTADQVRERLADGRLPASAEASARPSGEYQPLASFEEFRVPKAGLAKPAPAAAPSVPPPEPAAPEHLAVRPRTSRWLWAAGAAAVCLSALAAVGYRLLF